MTNLVSLIIAIEFWLMILIVGAIFVQSILSWLMPGGRGSRFMVLLGDISDPILRPIRNVIPPFGMLDLSPMIGMFVVFVIYQFAVFATRLLAGV